MIYKFQNVIKISVNNVTFEIKNLKGRKGNLECQEDLNKEIVNDRYIQYYGVQQYVVICCKEDNMEYIDNIEKYKLMSETEKERIRQRAKELAKYCKHDKTVETS